MFSVSLNFPSQLKVYWFLPPCWALPSITFYSSISTANIQGLPVVAGMSNVSHGLRIWIFGSQLVVLLGEAVQSVWRKSLGVGFGVDFWGGLWKWALGGTHSLLTLPLGSLCLVFVVKDAISASCCHSWPPCLSPLLGAVPLESEVKINLPVYIAHGHHSSREGTRPPHLLPFSALLGPVSFRDLGCHSWVFFLLWLEHTIKYGLTPRRVQPMFPNVL